ncbi:hypothetical protein [Tropicimonas aquimaris]|uniref:Serralysin n=1 Tax=Tropicimonas aquimaris TaxID=914152 RepID=A0ABW3IX80_9RHOB
MARVVYTKAHNYHYGYSQFENYSVVQFNVSKGFMVMRYDASIAGTYDPTKSPWKIKITFENLETYKPSSGKYKGEQIITSGDIKGIKWYDKSGDLEVKMTGISLDADEFHHYYLENASRTYDNLVAGGSTFVGPTNGTGMDVSTGSGDDTVDARGGGTFIKDKGGADTYIGSIEKYDTVSYSFWSYDRRPTAEGIDVDLANQQAIGPDGEVDTLIGIDQVFGTVSDDSFKGDDGDNVFAGLRGDDLIGGGKGFDTALYFRDSIEGGYDGIIVNMYTGEVRDGFGTTDTLSNIEKIVGTSTKDRFISNNKDNWFEGRGGKDKFIFKGGKFGSDTITDFTQSQDKIEITKANSLSRLTITQEDGGTLIAFNDNSDIFLKDFDGTLTASDFIF